MKTRTAIIIVALVLAANGVWAADDNATEEENSILTLVLKCPYADGGYTVVVPETTFRNWNSDEISDPEKYKLRKKAIADKFQICSGVVVTQLVDRLFERNKKTVRLTIKSSPKDGYLIDFDGKYKKYFAKDGGGWDKFYRENPKAVGFTRVSLPVYDQKTGLVLVYRGTSAFYGRAGEGLVILYRYEKGKLKVLSRATMWMS